MAAMTAALLLAALDIEPHRMPEWAAAGPFRFVGTYDYDAAGEFEIDLTDADAIADVGLTSKFRDRDQPEWIGVFTRIRVTFVDQAAQEHPDPEDTSKVFDAVYLKLEDGARKQYRAVADACGFDLDMSGIVPDSDYTTGNVPFYGRKSAWIDLPEEFVVAFADAQAFSLAWKSGHTSLWSADSRVHIDLDGVIVRASHAKELLERSGKCHIDPDVIADSRRRRARRRISDATYVGTTRG